MPAQFFGAQAAVTFLNRAFANTSPSNAAFNNQVTNATAALASGADATQASSYTGFAKTFGAAYASQTPAALSTLLMTNLGLLPNAALETALADYITAAGTANVGIVALQLATLLSAKEGDATYGAAATAWNNEVNAAATYSTNTANTTPQTGDVVAPPANQGQTFTLTINQDSFTGNTSNDTFNAVASQDGAGTLINTIQSVDVIDGGAGTDTLNATLAQANTVSASIKNIENINVRFADAKAVLDLANATGLTAVTVADSTTAGALDNVGALANLTVKNQNSGLTLSGTAASATTLALNLDTVGSATAAITLDLGKTAASKATTANITANNAYVTVNSTAADVLTTATVAATGTNVLTLTDSVATLTSVTVTGAGSVDLTGATFAALKTFDGSASTGAIKATITDSKSALTLTTGGGADVINASAVATALSSANLGAGNDTLFVGKNLSVFDKGANGGDGTDIISITDGSTLTSTTAKYITNFETLDVSGGTGAYDVSLNSFATVQIDEAIAGALAGAVEFKNAADTFTLTIASKAKTDASFDVVKGITVTGKDYTGTTAKGDAETLTLVANINDANKDSGADGSIDAATTGSVTAAGVENLVIKANVTATDGGTTAVKSSAYSFAAKITASEAETITISGDALTNLSSVTTIGVVSKIDATGNTGGTNIKFTGHAKSVAFTGGDGVDTYLAGTKGDVIYTGKGADVVTLDAKAGTAGAVRDTYVLKAATDSQVTDTSKDSKITLAADTGFDTVTKFDSIGDTTPVANTSDRLDLTNFAFSGSQRGVSDVSASVTTSTNLTSITGMFSTPAGNRGVAFSTDGTDTYVFVDANKDGNFTAADDLVVKLAGITTISETAINF